MANKVKTHSNEILNSVKTISTALHAAFLTKRITMSQLVKETGLSSNSIKTIFKGETANIASYIAVALVLGVTIGVDTSMVAKSSTVPQMASEKVKLDPAAPVEAAAPKIFL